MYKFFIKHSPVVPIGISDRTSKQWKALFGEDVDVIPLQNRKFNQARKSEPRRTFAASFDMTKTSAAYVNVYERISKKS